jgi:hypothetical protein
MKLTERLQKKATELNLITPNTPIDTQLAFKLVRDMPYRRASSRKPETIIDEWKGTCSGKHYLLRDLFAELGYPSRVMACTTEHLLNPDKLPSPLGKIMEKSGGRFVDVHNYLILETPEGEMVVDATWPLSTRPHGFIVNDTFSPGRDQEIACNPIETWEVPQDQDPQAFKEGLLRAHFSTRELEVRDQFIRALGELLST